MTPTSANSLKRYPVSSIQNDKTIETAGRPPAMTMTSFIYSEFRFRSVLRTLPLLSDKITAINRKSSLPLILVHVHIHRTMPLTSTLPYLWHATRQLQQNPAALLFLPSTLLTWIFPVSTQFSIPVAFIPPHKKNVPSHSSYVIQSQYTIHNSR